MKRRAVYRIGLGVLLLVVVIIGGFAVWATTPLPASEDALAALHSDAGVAVEEDHWITFLPVGAPASTGLILYPGGRVDPRGYAPLARAIAERGHLVVIVPMPLNLAVFAPGRAREVIASLPDVETWAVGGHSLGGAMAANYSKQADIVGGLVLWAAYPASSDDLSTREDLAVLSIYATRDGLMTDEERMASEQLLPHGTCWVAIEGGNHAQFGAYGVQRGDSPATLSASAQQARIVEATALFLDGLAGAANGVRLGCRQLGGVE
jgi:pimeloyl-ACP methyl ester carboxylesterase